jgi:hypothetical protein
MACHAWLHIHLAAKGASTECVRALSGSQRSPAPCPPLSAAEKERGARLATRPQEIAAKSGLRPRLAAESTSELPEDVCFGG